MNTELTSAGEDLDVAKPPGPPPVTLASLILFLAGAAYVAADLMGILYSPFLGAVLLVLAVRELAAARRRRDRWKPSDGQASTGRIVHRHPAAMG